MFYMFFMLFLFFLILFLFMFKKNKFLFMKKSCFECGIDSWSMNENLFSMRFFFVGMIFLIFDIELMVLFPFYYYYNLKIYIFFILLNLIFFSLIYEWFNNSLVWK